MKDYVTYLRDIRTHGLVIDSMNEKIPNLMNKMPFNDAMLLALF